VMILAIYQHHVRTRILPSLTKSQSRKAAAKDKNSGSVNVHSTGASPESRGK
jgi:hypothetical protein